MKEYGLDVGNTHFTYEGYKLYLSIMSQSLSFKTKKQLLEQRFACLSSDGSDDFGHCSQEGIFVRVCTKDGRPRTVFIGIEELNYQDAANLWGQIQRKLTEYGFDVATLKKKLVSVCFAGASVNMGVVNGLQALIKSNVAPSQK